MTVSSKADMQLDCLVELDANDGQRDCQWKYLITAEQRPEIKPLIRMMLVEPSPLSPDISFSRRPSFWMRSLKRIPEEVCGSPTTLWVSA
jgi:hypothetical protein